MVGIVVISTFFIANLYNIISNKLEFKLIFNPLNIIDIFNIWFIFISSNNCIIYYEI
jgi:hypothetical protein